MFVVADDELSRLIRIVEPLDPSANAQSGRPRKPIEEVLGNLLAWFHDQLTGAGWPDPTADLVFRNGEWTGRVVGPFHRYRGEEGLEHVLSATAIRYDLESRDLGFSDEWFCAVIVQNILAALRNPDNERQYAMKGFSPWLR